MLLLVNIEFQVILLKESRPCSDAHSIPDLKAINLFLLKASKLPVQLCHLVARLSKVTQKRMLR